jgi:hypothetical protein
VERLVVSGPLRSGVARRLSWIAALMLAVACVIALVVASRGGDGDARGSAARERARLASAPPATRAPIDVAADGLPIKPSDPHAPTPDGPMHPHPHTPAHERIYRENNLVGALNLAMDYADAPRMREIVAQYRAEYPEDRHRLQDGYALIADCLEGPDVATRARAQRFWETQIRSQTRRYVRRHCLER